MAVAVMLVVVGSVLALQAALDRRWALLANTIVIMLLAGICIHFFRRPRPPRLPATLLLGWMLLTIILFGSTQDGLYLSTSVWPGMLALLAMYLLGPRRGTVYAAVAVLQIFWSLGLHHSGVNLPAGYVPPPDSWLSVSVTAIGVATIAGLGYLYEAAQKRTLGELEDALIASEHHERQLEALFESTTSAACSLDRDLRLLTCNRVFAGLLPPGTSPAHGEALPGILPPAQWARWRGPIERVLAGDSAPTIFEEPPPGPDGLHRETVMYPLRSGDRVVGVTVFSRDITARKRAEAELRQLNQELVRVSRQAGMSAVASEVLHNAGNVLNSTGVSVAMLEQHVRNLKTGHMSRAMALLAQHRDRLDVFLREDPRGRQVLELLHGLAEHFTRQRQQLTTELASLRDSTDYLARVIQAQQSHARALGVIETVPVDDLIDAALALHAPSWDQLGIKVERRIEPLPPLHTDRHKVLEILLNLVSNARHALRDSDRPDKRLRIRAELVPAAAVASAGAAPTPDTGRVRIHVEDNGPGIAPEHRERLFRLGFTTRPNGNGIGLHASAVAAQQLGGTLSFHSDGPGQGATFTLELPLVPPAREWVTGGD
jgi:two-component system sensor kinase FixL